jgi:hypothetical protein
LEPVLLRAFATPPPGAPPIEATGTTTSPQFAVVFKSIVGLAATGWLVGSAGTLVGDAPPAERLMGKPMQETLTAVTLAFMNDLAPGQLTDARFDPRKD